MKNRIKNIFSRFVKSDEHEKQISELEKRLDEITDEVSVQEFARAYEDKGLDLVTEDIIPNYSFTRDRIDTATLQALYKTEGWFYICVEAITKALKSLPIKVQKGVETTETVDVATGITETVTNMHWVDSSSDHLQHVFDMPNDIQVAVNFYQQIYSDLISTGKTFIYVDKGIGAQGIDRGSSASGEVQGLYRINPAIVKVIRGDNGKFIKGYTVQTEGGYKAFTPDEMIYINLPDPADPYEALPPIVPVYKSIKFEQQTTEFLVRFYSQGARLGGVIEGAKKFTKDQLARLQRSFESSFTGKKNHHRTLILPDGMTYKLVQQDPAGGSLLELLKANREPIFAAFGVPPVVVGLLDGASYANANIQEKIFYRNTVIPYTVVFEQSFSKAKQLNTDPAKKRFKYDVSSVEVLQDNLSERADTSEKLLKAGWSVNEVRKEIWKKPEAEGGNVIPAIENAKPKPVGMLAAPKAEQTKDQRPNAQPSTALNPDVVPTRATYEDRMVQLVGIATADGLPLDQAIRWAMDRMKLEGYETMSGAKPAGSLQASAADPNGSLQANTASAVIVNDDPEAIKTIIDGFVKASMVVQSILCSKERFKSADEAGKWVTDHGFKNDGVDETPDTYRYRQRNPEDFKQESFRTIKMTDGVQAVVGMLKEPEKTPGGTNEPAKETTIENESDQGEKEIVPGYTKEMLQDHCKKLTDTDEINDLIGKRAAITVPFFKDLEEIYIKSLYRNLKMNGIFCKIKSDEDLVDEKEVAKAEAKQVKAALPVYHESANIGYSSHLLKFDIGYPNERANAILAKDAAKKVTMVSESTKNDLKTIITDSREAQESIGETAKKIRGYFEDLTGDPQNVRAITIGRTETLSAISSGQQIKVQEVKKEFPKKKLLKAWISPMDPPRAREVHMGLDQEGAIPESKAFNNGLMYPRDPNGDAEDVINCRCSWICFAAEDEDEIAGVLDQPSSMGDVA